MKLTAFIWMFWPQLFLSFLECSSYYFNALSYANATQYFRSKYSTKCSILLPFIRFILLQLYLQYLFYWNKFIPVIQFVWIYLFSIYTKLAHFRSNTGCRSENLLQYCLKFFFFTLRGNKAESLFRHWYRCQQRFFS